MNKKYIKRQITLDKLGIPMDKDIQKYYDYFHSLIGDINELEELTHDDYPDSIFWRKDGKLILEYETKNGNFWIDYTIWLKFEEEYGLNYSSISELLGGMLENTFKLVSTTTGMQEEVHAKVLEGAFKLRLTTTKKSRSKWVKLLKEVFKS